MDTEKEQKSANSYANAYEIDLLEVINIKTTAPEESSSQEKLTLSFVTMDEIIPKLGTFQRVMKAIRDDLYDGVFSNQYSSFPDESRAYQTQLQRIPYFILLQRIHQQRNEKADKLMKEIDKFKERIKEKATTIQERDVVVQNLKQQISELENHIIDVEGENKNHKLEIKRLQNVKSDIEIAMTKMKEHYETSIANLKIEINAKDNEVKKLKIYKDGYDALHDAFDNTNVLQREEDVTAESLFDNEDKNQRMEQIRKDVEVIKTLEEQLYSVRSSSIEEYDKFLESRTKNFQKVDTHIGIFNEVIWEQEDARLEREAVELSITQSGFTKTIAEIEEEVTLLVQQREGLEAEWQRLEQDHIKSKEAKRKKTKVNQDKSMRTNSAASLDELELVEIMKGKRDNPFVSHESILNKYSAMIYTSCNNGKTFYEMPEAAFCQSCSVKSIICPHKVSVPEKIYDLPKNCSHIKITRPRVKAKKAKGRRSKEPSPDIRTNTNKTLVNFDLVWTDLKTRTKMDRQISRILDSDSIQSILNQFYALMVWQDDYQPDNQDKFETFLESFYSFLHDRYLLDEVVSIVAHDIFNSIQVLVNQNRQIHLFAKCLCGATDASVVRYILLMCDFIDKINWKEVTDFVPFVSMVYPCLTEDDLEQLKMGYTSFSENKISKDLVLQYLLYILLQGKEPRCLEMEAKLIQQPVRYPGYFADIEFAEAVDIVAPLASERLLHRLFAQSEKHFPERMESITLKRAAEIASYLSLLQLSPKLKIDVADLEETLQKNRKSSDHSQEECKPNRIINIFNFRQLSLTNDISVNPLNSCGLPVVYIFSNCNIIVTAIWKRDRMQKNQTHFAKALFVYIKFYTLEFTETFLQHKRIGIIQ